MARSRDMNPGVLTQGEDELPWIETPSGGTYEEEPLISRKLLLSLLGGFLVLLAVVVGGAYWLMTRGEAQSPIDIADSGADAQIIRAADTPFKVRPDDPGGVSVPDQDKTVLAEAGGEAPDLSGAVGSTSEEPVPPPLPGPAPGPESMSGPPVTVKTPATPAPQPALAAPKPPVQAAAKPVATPKPLVAAIPRPPVQAAAKPAVTPKPAAKPAPVTAASGGFVLQLGAFSSRDRAMAGWAEYQAKYGALSGLAPDVQAVQSGGRTLYRLRAASLSSQSAANAKCAQVKSQGLSCIVAGR